MFFYFITAVFSRKDAKIITIVFLFPGMFFENVTETVIPVW